MNLARRSARFFSDQGRRRSDQRVRRLSCNDGKGLAQHRFPVRMRRKSRPSDLQRANRWSGPGPVGGHRNLVKVIAVVLAESGVLGVLFGCDPVPNLYVIPDDAAVAPNDAGNPGNPADGGADADAASDVAAEGCDGVSCPACPPNPGMCCPSGVACLGDNCAVDCASACSACAPGICCSKQGGSPVCRSADAGQCPP
jgi:hypothetical protein